MPVSKQENLANAKVSARHCDSLNWYNLLAGAEALPAFRAAFL